MKWESVEGCPNETEFVDCAGFRFEVQRVPEPFPNRECVPVNFLALCSPLEYFQDSVEPHDTHWADDAETREQAKRLCVEHAARLCAELQEMSKL